MKDCNIVNSTIRSTATLIGIHVVVGGWKSHVFAIQNTKAAIQHPRPAQFVIMAHSNIFIFI